MLGQNGVFSSWGQGEKCILYSQGISEVAEESLHVQNYIRNDITILFKLYGHVELYQNAYHNVSPLNYMHMKNYITSYVIVS